MVVNFKKKMAGKRTKLSQKSLNPSLEDDNGEPIIAEDYIEGNLYNLPISTIFPNPNQPRIFFDEGKLTELANSIKAKGVLQPIIITKNKDDNIEAEFMLVAGERRYRASLEADLKNIPAIFTSGNPEEIALIENLLRDDLKPIEEAEAYKRIIDSHGYTHEQLGDVVGKARTTISEILILNQLPKTVKQQSMTTDTPKNVLLEIAKRKDPEEMERLYDRVKNENLTVKKIRQLTRPRPARQVRETEQRALEKIIESKRLIYKLNMDSLDVAIKATLFREVEDLYITINKLLGNK